MSIFWIALAAFAFGTEAFVIVGLLPVIAADLQISLAAAGQLVTTYAITYAVGSPILAVTFNNFDRKTVLTLALSCFIAGNLLAVAATSFPALLISRIFMALGAGLCAPTGLAIAVAIAAPERRGRAIALVSSGTTVATVLGAPIGTLIGNAFGWRSAFVLVAVLGAIALAGLSFGLPRGLPRPRWASGWPSRSAAPCCMHLPSPYFGRCRASLCSPIYRPRSARSGSARLKSVSDC